MSGNKFPTNTSTPVPPSWSFLTKHAQVLVCVSRDPEARLRDVALCVNLTERRVQSILSDLIVSGYVVKAKSGRRNRYKVRDQAANVDIPRRHDDIAEIVTLLGI